ncbi:MAG: hypothetical protein M0C28_45155 [Candidatus Moduliflexus flocculans]|nr:hypothetical protein [Candidatus Moduliflexus flocculans]
MRPTSPGSSAGSRNARSGQRCACRRAGTSPPPAASWREDSRTRPGPAPAR